MQRTGAGLRTLILALPLTLGPAALAAQQEADSVWDVTQPRGRTREVDFTTTEGTWTALDVSPDGTWIVFDLLGHIYRMPIGGGEAQALTQESGIAVNVQPRISPDGTSIVFISDRKGQMNVWLMNADGTNPRPVRLDDRVQYRFPTWVSGGRFIVASAQPRSGTRSLVMLHPDGGQGLDVLKGEPGSSPFRVSASPDGRYLYYDVYTSRQTGIYGRDDALMGAVQVRRLDLETGVVRPLTAGEETKGNAEHSASGGGYAAEASPDGRRVSFMRKVPGGTLNYKGQRFGPRSALWIRDLSSGTERLAMDPVEMDLSEESFPINGTYPAYKWMPDGKSIVIHQGAKIRRLEVASGRIETIPFSVRVRRTISEQAWPMTKLSDGPVDLRFIRWASRSPDGRILAFQAIGRIWLQDLPNGTPRRLTSESFQMMEFQPAWSPDGQSIAFTSWQDEERGALWVVPARGGTPRRLTAEPGEYANPAWTPDGRELVVARGAGSTARGSSLVRNPFFDLVRIPAAGGDERFVVQVGRTPMIWGREADLVRPTIGTDGRIYFGEPKTFGLREGAPPERGLEIISVRADGSERRVQARITSAGDAAVSPDGRWVAFTQGMNAYLAPLPAGAAAGAVPMFDRKSGAFPARALSTEGGYHPRWRTADVVELASGNRFFGYDAATRRADTLTVRLTAPRHIAKGSIALTGARIVPLDGKPVIPSGTVVVRDGRIACVGKCSTAGVDRVVSASGKTIIPGWIDMHAHQAHQHMGMIPAHDFESAIFLAYGVTTAFDPSATSTDPFATAELIETGQSIGARLFTSAEAITGADDYGTNEVTSLEQALREVGRRKWWGSPMVKQYSQPTRRQRQWVVEAVRRLGLRTTAEGSADMYFKLGMVMDGHTGGEHLTVHAPIYSDFLTFMAKANYVYSHTPLVSGYGAWNDEYFWQESTLWKDAKLQRWTPWRELIPHTRRFVMRPETDYSKDIVARTVADLIELGGRTAIGSHGQEQGIGSHWDVWMLAKAAGPLAALEVASMHGARFLGMEQDLGSIAPGKLADLMVLDANPLENIRNTASIRYVMKAGTLYDAMSLDELWPRQLKWGSYYWVVPEMYRVDEKRIDEPAK